MSSQPIHPENERRLFEIFKMAVQDERKAQAVYLQALRLCSDPSLRPILEGLIADEARHEQILVERYNVLAARNAASSQAGGQPDDMPWKTPGSSQTAAQ